MTVIRVTRSNLCPVCDHYDWCLVAEDRSAAICQRIEDGAKKRVGDAGWLHIIDDTKAYQPAPTPRQPRLPKRSETMTELAARCVKRLNDSRWAGWRDELSQRLTVTKKSLRRLGLGWDGSTWTFPMRNEKREIVGIRRRFRNGKKVAETGSRNGLFIPTPDETRDDDGLLLICEGESDLCASLDMGFNAIAVPGAGQCVRLAAEFCRGRDVVVVRDADRAGLEGAQRLVDALLPVCPIVRTIAPPEGSKDVREWRRCGAEHHDVLELINGAELLRMPTITSTPLRRSHRWYAPQEVTA